MACDVTASPAPTAGKPHALFALPRDGTTLLASPDGSKFLVFVSVGAPRTALTLVQSWSAQLEQRQEK